MAEDAKSHLKKPNGKYELLQITFSNIIEENYTFAWQKIIIKNNEFTSLAPSFYWR